MKSDVLNKIAAIGFVPEYVACSSDDATFVAQCLVAGNLPVLTLKGECALDAISVATKSQPQCLVGVSGLKSFDEIKNACSVGAQYVVMNTFDEKLLEDCAALNIAVIPSVGSSSELARAQVLGLELVNYFPYTKDSLDALKALSDAYPSMHFLLSGTIDRATAYKALLNPKVAAVMGDFMIDKDGVKDKNVSAVSCFAENTILTYLNFHVAHMGLNAESKDESVAMAKRLATVIHRPTREGKKSAFAGKLFEIMYSPFYYEKGHVALGSYDATRAYHYLKRTGTEFIEDSLSFDANGRVIAGYMKENFGGFGIHLLQCAPDFWDTL